jgi:hypothetical protein
MLPAARKAKTLPRYAACSSKDLKPSFSMLPAALKAKTLLRYAAAAPKT